MVCRGLDHHRQAWGPNRQAQNRTQTAPAVLTACYGATHAADFVRAGFRIASGAVGVNANGAHDYPAQLLVWGLGAPYKDALKAGNNRQITALYDKLARKANFEDVNSIKLAMGRGSTSISSSAV